MDLKNKQKEDKKKTVKIIIALIFSALATLILHLKLKLLFTDILELSPGEFLFNFTLGYIAILLTFFLVFFLVLIFAGKISKGVTVKRVELTEDEKRRKKQIRVEIVFIILDLLMTSSFVGLNWEQLKNTHILLAIAEVAAFFAIVWFGFEFFNRFKFIPQKIFSFVYKFVTLVCIPMLFLLTIMLGAYQVKYNYADTFTPQLAETSIKFGNYMSQVYYKSVSILIDIGRSNPDLWIWLPIAAFFVMTLILLFATFTKKEKKDEEMNAEELIELSLKEEAERIAFENNPNKPLIYNFVMKLKDKFTSKEDKEKELAEKEAEAKAEYKIYDITLTQMKGGIKRK